MPSRNPRRADTAGLEMNLLLATRACLAHLPGLAARRLRTHLDDIARLQSATVRSASAGRLSRKLFSLLANASVHRGGADTLRPLYEHCSVVRSYLWLRERTVVVAPEPLQRGAPDLVVETSEGPVWVDVRVRLPEVLATRTHPAVLLVDRTMSLRREPPLRLGAGYAGEFHLLDTRVPGADSVGAYTLEQQPVRGVGPGLRMLRALASATGADAHPRPHGDTGFEHRA